MICFKPEALKTSPNSMLQQVSIIYFRYKPYDILHRVITVTSWIPCLVVACTKEKRLLPNGLNPAIKILLHEFTLLMFSYL